MQGINIAVGTPGRILDLLSNIINFFIIVLNNLN